MVDDVKFLTSNTQRRVKITVPGPFTMSCQAQNDFYATDEQVKARLGWQAEFSKTLFLKFKDGRFALLLTHRDGRLDNKAVKAALGAKPSICTAEKCANTSAPPPSGSMKPNPLASLNHFTVPCAI